MKILFLLALAAASPAIAGPSGYLCKIKEQLSLSPSGTLVKSASASHIGKQFAIDRQTGRVIEPAASTWILGGSKATVLAEGNQDNSFQTLITAPAFNQGVHVAFARVDEYATGPLKPFLLLVSSTVYSGECE